jgi:hypothetical protein
MRVLAHHSGALAASVLVLVSGGGSLTLEPVVLFHLHARALRGRGGDAIGLGDNPGGVGLLLHILESEFLRLGTIYRGGYLPRLS